MNAEMSALISGVDATLPRALSEDVSEHVSFAVDVQGYYVSDCHGGWMHRNG